MILKVKKTDIYWLILLYDFKNGKRRCTSFYIPTPALPNFREGVYICEILNLVVYNNRRILPCLQGRCPIGQRGTNNMSRKVELINPDYS
jgi:hypothetical protein